MADGDVLEIVGGEQVWGVAALAAGGATRWLGPYTLRFDDRLIPGTPEIMDLAVDTPTPASGTFQLFMSLAPYTGTDPIPWDATAAQVKTALDAIGAGIWTSTVTGGPLPATIEISLTPLTPTAFALDCDSTGLAGGTYAATETTAGEPPTQLGIELFDVEAGDLLLRAEMFVVLPFASPSITITFGTDPLALGVGDWPAADLTPSGGDTFDPPLVERNVTGKHSTQETAAAATLFLSYATRVEQATTLYAFGDSTANTEGEVDIYVEVARPVVP